MTSSVDQLLIQNKNWADGMGRAFFASGASQQSPKILWIGCCDSRVPETTILNMRPGDIFVHRNIANVVNQSDVSLKGIIRYAVETLKVKLIIVCGHSDCGGVKVAFNFDNKPHYFDDWVAPVRAIATNNWQMFNGIPDKTRKVYELASLRSILEIELIGQCVVWRRGG
jgi:carbonic anhydrase